MPLSGIDTSTFDHSVRPQDDLFRHVNGAWIAAHVIPEDRSADGAFRELRDQAELDVRAIIEGAASGEFEDADAARIGAVFTSFMNEDVVEALGVEPMRPDLDAIAAITTRDELVRTLGALGRTGVSSPVYAGVETDPADPERYIVWIMQGGLGLPDEAYYREEQHAEILRQYGPHITRMLTLAGVPDAEQLSARALAVETRLAANHWDVVASRDMSKTFNPMDFAGLKALSPSFDWDAWLDAAKVPASAFADLNVEQPSYIEAFSAAWDELPLEDWIAWLTWHTVSARASFLHDEIVQANFDFYGKVLSGTPQLRERWKRGVSLVEGALGEGVGRLFVSRHFPESAKTRMEELVGKLIEAYRANISALEWMGEDTRKEALVKLDGFTPKIGYPSKWRDYSALVVDPDDLLGNVRRINAFELDYDYSRIGKPVDLEEWGMTPQTVNAYYHPIRNEIVFPAAILRPPFFNADADDAVNYGGIGAVIGHEIGHGFDDQGSKFDGTGTLRDWWTDSDRTEFEARTSALIAQYDAFVPTQFQGNPENGAIHVNGALTIGENIGDLGGLSIAIKAYELALAEDGLDRDSAPVIDGFTATERVFYGWAQVWRDKMRDEELKRRIATDPHSPDEFRCNGIVANLDEFEEAFGVKEGDALYRSPESRVRIW